MQVIGKRKRTSKDKADSIERIKIENNYRNGTRQSQARKKTQQSQQYRFCGCKPTNLSNDSKESSMTGWKTRGMMSGRLYSTGKIGVIAAEWGIM